MDVHGQAGANSHSATSLERDAPGARSRAAPPPGVPASPASTPTRARARQPRPRPGSTRPGTSTGSGSTRSYPTVDTQAVDAETLLAAIDANRTTPRRSTERRAGGGSPLGFLVKGTGKVTKVDTGSPTGPDHGDAGAQAGAGRGHPPDGSGDRRHLTSRRRRFHQLRPVHQPDRLRERRHPAQQPGQDRRLAQGRPGVPDGKKVNFDGAFALLTPRTISSSRPRCTVAPDEPDPSMTSATTSSCARVSQQVVRRRAGAQGRHLRGLPRQGQRAGRRERRRQVDADEDPLRRRSSRPRASPARRRAGRRSTARATPGAADRRSSTRS